MTEINLKRQLTPFEWLQLPVEIRNLFKATFQIPRSGGSIVNNNKLESDGHTIQDLSKVSLKSLQEYLSTDETHWDKLLQLTINKMEDKENGNAEIAASTDLDEGTVSKKRGTKKVKITV